ncbi:7451_t:CDS:2 [Paraglomus occultum]|uniref:7451_t:CDS:1 n=1 Tax=Paraglomus occultum TaxID=144539 RepID=A0A9N8WJV3_9GLOM|nr:7451_t:CDS:2 [Paraglomus occultum]
MSYDHKIVIKYFILPWVKFLMETLPSNKSKRTSEKTKGSKKRSHKKRKKSDRKNKNQEKERSRKRQRQERKERDTESTSSDSCSNTDEESEAIWVEKKVELSHEVENYEQKIPSGSPSDDGIPYRTQLIPSVAPRLASNPTLSADELNRLKAKALRAKLTNSPNAEELEKKYEMEKKRAEGNNKVEIVPIVDSRGRLYDTTNPSASSSSLQHAGSPRQKRKEKIDTHDETGNRIHYFKDDDKLQLQHLVMQERLGTGKSMDAQMAGRIMGDKKFEDDLDYLDEHADKMARGKEQTIEQKRQFAIQDFKKSQDFINSCPYCFGQDKSPVAPMVSLGTKTYLALSTVTEMTSGHCLIVPIQHCLTTLELDDDTWDEIRNFMKCLIQMFHSEDRGVLFFETVISFKYQKHAIIECIPLPWNLSQDAPAFFREAILSTAGEWTQNKKIIDTAKGFRNKMVKDLPYFHVWFNVDGGMGHVIENAKKFPEWFGKEIVAGMCDLPPDRWRKPKKLNPRDKHKRVQEFVKKWKKWDWTQMLEGGEY